MRTVGLITEYNPFHNGHLYHLQESLKVSGAEVAVAVMSGHFVQRGAPALVDKWRRAEMALRCGVDVVIELPFPWACNSAPHFARGAVQALNALGQVDSLCFGSEAGDLALLKGCADLILNNSAQVESATAALLRAGIPFPLAREQVVSALGKNSAQAEALRSPNNILGIEYLKALQQTESSMAPLTITRRGAGYNDTEIGSEPLASATAIRAELTRGGAVEGAVPPAVQELLTQAISSGALVEHDNLHRLLTARILRGAESLRGLYLVEDGIERRLVDAALSSETYEALVSSVKVRQFTRTRIQRLMACVLNEVRAEEMACHLESGPLYLHVLGASTKGRKFLASCRKSASLPLVQNYSRIRTVLKKHYGMGTRSHALAEKQLELELRATCNHTLLVKSWGGGNRNRDFFEDVRFVAR